MSTPARILAAAAMADAICIVVDVPCFTTAVEAAVTRGVTVYPFRWRDAGPRNSRSPSTPCSRNAAGPAVPRCPRVSMDTLAPRGLLMREGRWISGAPGIVPGEGLPPKGGWLLCLPRWHRAS